MLNVSKDDKLYIGSFTLPFDYDEEITINMPYIPYEHLKYDVLPLGEISGQFPVIQCDKYLVDLKAFSNVDMTEYKNWTLTGSWNIT